jgi:hypothetical protein
MTNLRASLAILLAKIGYIFTINDIFMLIGIAATVRGISMIYVPAAWIFAGLVFLCYGWWGIVWRRRGAA